MNTNITSFRCALKVTARPVIKLVCLVLARLVRQRKNKILFHSLPDAADNSWHLYRYMASNVDGKHFVWFCETPALVKDRILRTNGTLSNRVSVVKNRSISSLIHFASAKYLFLSHGLPSFLPVLERLITVNLWHGMPIKPIQFLNPRTKTRFVPYCYTLSTSEFFVPILAKAFEVSNKSIVTTGLPRNDALLVHNEAARAKLETTLEISAGTKIVFWLPTFRRPCTSAMPVDATINSFVDEWSDRFWARLSEAAVESGHVLVIKLHPLDVLNEQGLNFAGHSGIRVMSSHVWSRIGIDLYDALATSSALITDLSSVLIDYVITGNPIAITCGSQSRYSRGMITGTETVLSACYQIDSEDAFVDFLRNPLECAGQPNELTLYNRQAVDRYTACRSVVEAVQLA